MFFRCEAKSYKAEAKSIIRQSQQDFFRWEADIIIKQADITFRVLKKKQKKFPQISDVKVYLQTVKIKLATVTSIWLVIPLLSDIISRWMMAVCMFIWHVHLPEIIPILFLHLLMGSFKAAFCQYNIQPPGSVLEWEKEWSNRNLPVSIQKGGTYCLRYL